MTTNYIFVTGGVVSSLGKGIAAASLAAILEARGLKVTMMKLDPYINVDPGTMSPTQHGEVFVTAPFRSPCNSHQGQATCTEVGLAFSHDIPSPTVVPRLPKRFVWRKQTWGLARDYHTS